MGSSIDEVFVAIESESPHLEKYFPSCTWGDLVLGLRAMSQQINICCFTTGYGPVMPLIRRAAALILRYTRRNGLGQAPPYGSKLPLPDYIVLFDYYARRITDCAAQGSKGDATEFIGAVYGILLAAMREHGVTEANRVPP